jgi:FAD:protein FMN transferase
MGSRCELKLYAAADRVESVMHDCVAIVRRLEDKYTRYKPDSVTSKINANAGSSTPLALDDETLELLNYAHVLHQQSDGVFDITSGILRKAWNFKSNQLPSVEQINQLLPCIGWHLVELNPPFFHLPLQGMEIDFGGFVKEYTADVIADFCRENHIHHGLVNLGGDIHIIGPHPEGAPWQVGIQHPRQLDKAITSVDIPRGAIATSGDYERFMVIDGVRYSHLLNPKTGQSIQTQFASASVIAERCLIAGSFTTIALLKSQTEPDWLASIGLPYLLVDQQMRIQGSIEGIAK